MKHRRMFKVELYGRVRRAVLVEGRSQRAVAREFGIARKTIQKMLRYSVPPGYQRQQAVKRPKLGPWLAASCLLPEWRRSRPATAPAWVASLPAVAGSQEAPSNAASSGSSYARSQTRALPPVDSCPPPVPLAEPDHRAPP